MENLFEATDDPEVINRHFENIKKHPKLSMLLNKNLTPQQFYIAAGEY